MYNLDTQVNVPVIILYVGAAPSLTTFSDNFLFLNGVLNTTTPVVVTYTGQDNIYTVTITPYATGYYTYYANGSIQASINVVTKGLYSSLQDLSDESVGSWTWDKTTGLLEMLRQDGTSLANFNVIDTLSSASRERV